MCYFRGPALSRDAQLLCTTVTDRTKAVILAGIPVRQQTAACIQMHTKHRMSKAGFPRASLQICKVSPAQKACQQDLLSTLSLKETLPKLLGIPAST